MGKQYYQVKQVPTAGWEDYCEVHTTNDKGELSGNSFVCYLNTKDGKVLIPGSDGLSDVTQDGKYGIINPLYNKLKDGFTFGEIYVIDNARQVNKHDLNLQEAVAEKAPEHTQASRPQSTASMPAEVMKEAAKIVDDKDKVFPNLEKVQQSKPAVTLPSSLIADTYAVYGLNEQKGFREAKDLSTKVGDADKFVKLGVLATRLMIDKDDQKSVDPKYGRDDEDKKIRLRAKQSYKRNRDEIQNLKDLLSLEGHKFGQGLERSTVDNIMAVVNSAKTPAEKKQFLVNAIAGFAIADRKLIENYDKPESVNNAFIKEGNSNLKYVERLCQELYKLGGTYEEYEKSFKDLNVASIVNGMSLSTPDNKANLQEYRFGIKESGKTPAELQNMVEELAKREFNKNTQRSLLEDYKKSPDKMLLKLTEVINKRIEKGDYDAIGNILTGLKVEYKDKTDAVTNKSYQDVKQKLLNALEANHRIDKFKFTHAMMEFNYIGAEDRKGFQKRHKGAIEAILKSEKGEISEKGKEDVKRYIKEMVYATPKINNGAGAEKSVQATTKFLAALSEKGEGLENIVKESLMDINRGDLYQTYQAELKRSDIKTIEVADKFKTNQQSTPEQHTNSTLLSHASNGNIDQFRTTMKTVITKDNVDKVVEDIKNRGLYEQLALAGGSYLYDFNKHIKDVGGSKAATVLQEVSEGLLKEHERDQLRRTPTYLPQTAIHELEKMRDDSPAFAKLKTKAKAAARGVMEAMGGNEKQSYDSVTRQERAEGKIRDSGRERKPLKADVTAKIGPKPKPLEADVKAQIGPKRNSGGIGF